MLKDEIGEKSLYLKTSQGKKKKAIKTMSIGYERRRKMKGEIEKKNIFKKL
jgi:hypothetical protein